MREGALWSGTARDRAFDVVGLGESSLDQVGFLDEEPRLGRKTWLREYRLEPGGTIATAVLACARLGLRAAFLGSVGDDSAAAKALAPLVAAGVDVSSVLRRRQTPTRIALILVDRRSGERTVLGYRDPALHVRPDEIDRSMLENAHVVHLDATDPDAALWAAGVAREAGAAVVLDVDRVWPGAEALLRRVDFPVVSRQFAEEWRGGSSLREGLRQIAATGARMAVVTVGPFGALAQIGDRQLESPAFRVEARDTTGAGDAFHAGFIWGLLQGYAPEPVLRTANAVAGLNCEGAGAQGGLPTREELEKFVASRVTAVWRDPEADGGG